MLRELKNECILDVVYKYIKGEGETSSITLICDTDGDDADQSVIEAVNSFLGKYVDIQHIYAYIGAGKAPIDLMMESGVK